MRDNNENMRTMKQANNQTVAYVFQEVHLIKRKIG